MITQEIIPQIAIYCVTYHSYDSLKNYLLSIDYAMAQVADVVHLSVIVADNTSPATPFLYTSKNFELNILVTGENLGYFGAIRFAMQQICPTEHDYVIISNVDVLLPENFFASLINYNYEKNTAWIAPSILSKTPHFDFNPQAIKRYSNLKMRLLRLMFKYPLLLKLKQRLLHMYRNFADYPSGSIYAGHGCFIILTKTYFEQCGIIQYPIFLYGEEIYLAEVCRQHQLNVMYTPEISVTDIGSVSTGRIPFRTFCKLNYNAIDYLIKEFF